MQLENYLYILVLPLRIFQPNMGEPEFKSSCWLAVGHGNKPPPLPESENFFTNRIVSNLVEYRPAARIPKDCDQSVSQRQLVAF